MAQSAAQPIIDWRDKLVSLYQQAQDWAKPSVKKRPATAKELGWADQTNMRKVSSDNTKSTPQKKAVAKKPVARKRVSGK